MMNIKQRLHLTKLFETYNTLLTSRQCQIFNMYFGNDYSINEIAQSLNISKNGVFNSLKQSERNLINYEQNLKIVENYEQNCLLLKNAKVDEKIIKKLK